MAISDYDKVKALEVTSADGSPTISRTLAIKLTSGDETTTGTGEIALDWSNIDGPEDIAIFDEDGNLLDYYIETFDASDEKAVVWVHRDWVRDGSVQAQIAYGDGPGDESVGASTVFGKESDLVTGYLFNEESGDLTDVSGEGHDGSVSGATQGENGVVGDAYQFDGSDDYVEIEVSGSHESLMDGSNEYTALAWLDVPSSAEITGNRHDLFIINDEWDVKISSYSEYLVSGGTEYKIWDGDNEHHVAGSDIRGQGPTLLTAVYDPDDGMKLYEGSTLEDSDSWTGTPDHINDNTIFVGGNPNRQADTYEGFLSHLRIISSALSAEEIAAFYEATKQTPELFSQQAAETAGDAETADLLASAQANELFQADVVARRDVAHGASAGDSAQGTAAGRGSITGGASAGEIAVTVAHVLADISAAAVAAWDVEKGSAQVSERVFTAAVAAGVSAIATAEARTAISESAAAGADHTAIAKAASALSEAVTASDSAGGPSTALALLESGASGEDLAAATARAAAAVTMGASAGESWVVDVAAVASLIGDAEAGAELIPAAEGVERAALEENTEAAGYFLAAVQTVSEQTEAANAQEAIIATVAAVAAVSEGATAGDAWSAATAALRSASLTGATAAGSTLAAASRATAALSEAIGAGAVTTARAATVRTIEFLAVAGDAWAARVPTGALYFLADAITITAAYSGTVEATPAMRGNVSVRPQ